MSFCLFESNNNQEEIYLVATCSRQHSDLYYVTFNAVW